ncbi:MAG: hypothetical protein Q8K70_00635 [Bacteroidota bacterium]|nr:hypothetical protein [Bacteroidota bacterium]
MKNSLVILLLLCLPNCVKECKDPIFHDFKDIYLNLQKDNITASIELTSSNGLKEFIKVNVVKSVRNITKSNCIRQSIECKHVKFSSTLYGFYFNMDFNPSFESNILNFTQRFNLNDSINLLIFDYAINTHRTIVPNDNDSGKIYNNSYLSRNITHKMIDSLTTKYGTTHDVYHLKNNDLGGIKNPHCIAELFFHQKDGLIRFITVDKTIWDLKK